MKLSQKVADEFVSSVRQKGQTYYWQHLVRIRTGNDNAVEAHVIGSERYSVNLNWDAPFLNVQCDCPYFQGEGPCKHLWAAILAAEAQGYLANAANAEEVFVDSDSLLDDIPLLAPPDKPELRAPQPAPWKREVDSIVSHKSLIDRTTPAWPSKREVLYQIERQSSLASGQIVLTLETRDRKNDGTFSHPSRLFLKRGQIQNLPTADRELIHLLSGSAGYPSWTAQGPHHQISASHILTADLATIVMPLAVGTGRCFLKTTGRPEASPVPLVWDSGEPWHLELIMDRRPDTGWAVTGLLKRGEETMQVRTPDLVVSQLVIGNGQIGRLAADAAPEWLSYMRTTGSISAGEKEGEDLMVELLRQPDAPRLTVHPDLNLEEIALDPSPALKIRAKTEGASAKRNLQADLFFKYGNVTINGAERSRGAFDSAARRFVRRNLQKEEEASSRLRDAGFTLRNSYSTPGGQAWELAAAKLPRAVRSLVEVGWHIEAEGKLFRRPGDFRMEVSSGVDWFELHGQVNFGETTARLPELLEALRRGENVVRLGDGTFGLLPEAWLEKLGMMAGLGENENGHVRFRKNQAGLLDALLAAQPETVFDEGFEKVREQLASFSGIAPAPQPSGFIGQLRDYQREGLGWIEFLRHFSFGGCLADDMGVGKTAQVLAVLESRREARAAGQPIEPSLVVAPSSLIFNWKQEANRFTPLLRVLDHTGATRGDADFSGYDVVLTTYGTLRRDAAHLKEIPFDYIVLDEAQAIKNSGTESAKAVRLLRGDHRLALSGTPVENHLGELFSLFEFLNPGMLGSSSVFKVNGNSARHLSEENRVTLAKALRPFILRRTKEQVARELPPKTEQTIYCEMEPAQRKLYDQLRQHYRSALLGRVAKEGLAKSKIQVLEALLRLRQAACHPGLIDAKRGDEASAKLEVLWEQLREVRENGHKALVFSQFTTLLKLVSKQLDAENIPYAYLDGSTRNRQEVVERFQNDPDCQLFLISLKAGGLGLNLTAAGYVFLLDPWWNPAVEAQAVDRAHRIGQTQQVSAYRLIARDTVEEKVLELQQTKRDLATAIISADNSIIKNLQKEDLELLLS